jgi:predicted RNA-binding protein with PIN domain
VRIRGKGKYREARLSCTFDPHNKGLLIGSGEQEISSIIIDGYNLIGTFHRDLEAQRNRLIDLLIDYRKRKGHTVVVVFDGWKEGSGGEHHSVRGGVRIIYSGLGEKADMVIKRLISSEDREWVVVTSDRDIAAHAWAKGSIPVSSEVFLPVIEGKRRSGDEGQYIEGADDEEESPVQRKGSPRKLSRKERALRRAVEKL